MQVVRSLLHPFLHAPGVITEHPPGTRNWGGTEEAKMNSTWRLEHHPIHVLNTSQLGQQPTPVPTTVRSSYFSAHLSWSKSQRSYNDLYNVSSHGLSDLISVYSLPCLLSSATWTLCSFLNVPGKLLPQGLSTCLRAFAPVNTTKSLSPPDIHMAHSLPHLLPIFAEMSLSQ